MAKSHISKTDMSLTVGTGLLGKPEFVTIRRLFGDFEGHFRSYPFAFQETARCGVWR
jgi:hypothetical protein